MMQYTRFGKYHRIDKRMARRLYDEGKDILFVPCNLKPDNDLGLGIIGNKYLQEIFDKWVDTYTWYYCNNERGRYVAFYEVKEG